MRDFLGKNKITGVGVGYIVETILAIEAINKKNETSTSLILEENEFGNDAVGSLSNLLAKTRRLTLLHIGSNQIDDGGIQTLVAGLKASRSILRFHIPFNKITDVGAAAIANNIPAQLITLNLSMKKN